MGRCLPPRAPRAELNNANPVDLGPLILPTRRRRTHQKTGKGPVSTYLQKHKDQSSVSTTSHHYSQRGMDDNGGAVQREAGKIKLKSSVLTQISGACMLCYILLGFAKSQTLPCLESPCNTQHVTTQQLSLQRHQTYWQLVQVELVPLVVRD